MQQIFKIINISYLTENFKKLNKYEINPNENVCILIKKNLKIENNH